MPGIRCCSVAQPRSDPIREMHLQSFGIHFSTLTKSAVFVEGNLFGGPVLRDSSWILDCRQSLPWDYFRVGRDPPRILSNRYPGIAFPGWFGEWIGDLTSTWSKECRLGNAASLPSQCLHRIDPRRPPCRNEAG